MRYETIFRESVEKYKPRVQEITGITLPEIKLHTWDQESLKKINTARYNFLIGARYLAGIETGVTFAVAELSPIIEGNNPHIWYNKLSILGLLPKKSIEHVAAHELGHVAHHIAAHRKGNDLRFKDEDIIEYVADYIAVLVTKTESKPSFENRSCQALGHIRGTLERIGLTFQEALPDMGFKDLEQHVN